jgi:hypothetical protein
MYITIGWKALLQCLNGLRSGHCRGKWSLRPQRKAMVAIEWLHLEPDTSTVLHRLQFENTAIPAASSPIDLH